MKGRTREQMAEVRRRAAELLRQGLTHAVIRERLGVSQETMTEVARALRKGHGE